MRERKGRWENRRKKIFIDERIETPLSSFFFPLHSLTHPSASHRHIPSVENLASPILTRYPIVGRPLNLLLATCVGAVVGWLAFLVSLYCGY